MYSSSVRLISFEIKLLSKDFETSRAEPEYMNIPPSPPPPINALAPALFKPGSHMSPTSATTIVYGYS